jgi:hypothetical protein
MGTLLSGLIIYRKETSQIAKHSSAVSVSARGACSSSLPQTDGQQAQPTSRQYVAQVPSVVGRLTQCALEFVRAEVDRLGDSYVSLMKGSVRHAS